jgi:large subunit ribosomal protein L29
MEAVNLLRSMTAEDLAEHLRLQRRKLFEVRFQQAAGQVENHRQVRELRREIARTMTLQLELARGHHLVSDLEVEEEPEERSEERPRPRGLLRRRSSAVSAAEGEPVETVAAGTDAIEAEPVEAELVESGPEPRPRAARRRRDSAASTVEEAQTLETAPDAAADEPPAADGETAAPEDAAEFADEGAAGPDEEQADE